MRFAPTPMPSPCRIDRQALEALLDKEAGPVAWPLGVHVRHCSLCSARLRELAALESALAQMRHLRARSLDPLRALCAIRRCTPRRPPLWTRLWLRGRWAWTFQRAWCCLPVGLVGIVAVVGCWMAR